MNLPIKQLQEITAKEMSRQEFLKFLGAGFLGIIGVWGLLHNLQSLQNRSIKSSRGYGSNPYGG
jgi:hypothetical protein